MTRTRLSTVLWAILDGPAKGDRSTVFQAANISESILARALGGEYRAGSHFVRQMARAYPAFAQRLIDAWSADQHEDMAEDVAVLAREHGVAPPSALPARRCTACGDLDDTQRAQLAALVHDMIAGGWDDTVPLLAQMARTVAAVKGGAPLPARAAQ